EWKLIPSKGQTREGNFFNFAKTHTIHFGQFEKTENGLYLSIKV
uniref:Fibrillin n=1 Tax=Meloidogyne hapla TaxID=6305 RepID=A0A1I8BM46_MELHA